MKILLLLSVNLAITFADIVNVVFNRLPDEVLLETEGLVIHYINEKRTMDNISESLTRHLNNEYGYRLQCLIGKEPMAMTLTPGTIVDLHLIYQDINYMFFRQMNETEMILIARNLTSEPIISSQWTYKGSTDYTDTIFKAFQWSLQSHDTISTINLGICNSLEGINGTNWLCFNALVANSPNIPVGNHNFQFNFHYFDWDGKSMKYYTMFYHGNLGFAVLKF